MKFYVKSIAFATALLSSSFAMAAYPEQPIKLIVPFAANGTADLLTKIVAEPLGKELGTTVTLETVAGNSGRIGTTDMLSAEADGYTLAITTISSLVTANDTSKSEYDALADFQHVANIADVPNVLIVRKEFPANNFKDFLEEVKKSKGKYNYGSSGADGMQHFLMEYLKNSAKVSISHVPYRGGGPAVKDVVKGSLDMVLVPISAAYSNIQHGDVKVIALDAPSRLKTIPDVPTFKELGFEDMKSYTYYGISGPKGLGKDVTKKLSEAIVKVVNMSDVKAKIEATGANPNPVVAEQYTKMIEKDKAAYEKMQSVMNKN
ncbi:MAG: tripartite tricarboxylate transporter substrate binding protein [Chryseobacterium sp.]|uniref:Bug family tripartite tricarboxylate transporter substrate binding protein n=1 Tax=Chryseobacterium sp. TaxID=1871047 RepID=UPI002FC7F3C8